MISIMIVDDHPMVREGLAAMLESEQDFQVGALAATGEEAVAIAGTAKPDVVLSDIRMPGIDGFGVLAKLKESYPDIRVLLMAGMPLKEEEARAREEGAKGYLPKNVDQDRLVAAIRTIAAGEPGFVCEEFQAAPSTLTARELDVLKEVASGKQQAARRNCRVARHWRGIGEDAPEGHHDEAQLPERDERRFPCVRARHSSGVK